MYYHIHGAYMRTMDITQGYLELTLVKLLYTVTVSSRSFCLVDRMVALDDLVAGFLDLMFWLGGFSCKLAWSARCGVVPLLHMVFISR